MSSPHQFVGIVVLNFNGMDCLSDCLSSLTRLRYDNKLIIVVDNDSADGSFEAAQKQFPQFDYIRNERNFGFARGMNIGIQRALERGAQWVWILNNDAEAEENSLELLLQVAETQPRAGLLSPYILSRPEGTLWFGKGRVNTLRMRVEHITPSQVERHSRYHESDFLTGCALLIKKEVFDRIGLLNEQYFLYYEDADFSLRAKNAGISLLAVPGARVHHEERSNMSNEKLYYLVYSGLLFFSQIAVGWRKPYLWLYGTIRRIKNALDIAFGREKAYIVGRAYDDYSHVHSSSHFPRFR